MISSLSKYINIIILIAFIGMISSCATENKTTKPEKKRYNYTTIAKQYMPLTVGNSWIYDLNYMGKKGTITILIKSEKEGWFMDNKGNEMTVNSSGIRDRSRYLLTFPLKENKDWSNVIAINKSETRKIISLDYTIKVPAGTFEGAIVVETKTPVKKNIILNSITYFVKGIGIVKIETFLEDIKNGKIYPQTATALKAFKIKNVKS